MEMTAEQLAEAVRNNRPRPYDLTNADELVRLYRECRGYLHTCHHKHGTDWEGRQFAMDALDALAKQTKLVRRLAAAERRATPPATGAGT